MNLYFTINPSKIISNSCRSVSFTIGELTSSQFVAMIKTGVKSYCSINDTPEIEALKLRFGLEVDSIPVPTKTPEKYPKLEKGDVIIVMSINGLPDQKQLKKLKRDNFKKEEILQATFSFDMYTIAEIEKK